jgi:hypothetical protein
MNAAVKVRFYLVFVSRNKSTFSRNFATATRNFVLEKKYCFNSLIS